VTISNIIGGDQGSRSEKDYYPTPAIVTHTLMQVLDLPSHTRVWEPAAGTFDMALVLSQYVGAVTCTDIQTGQDFLSYTSTEPFDWIITNPPFSQAEEFIRRAHSFNVPFAMLLKGHYWHAKTRMALFNECQPHFVMPLTWRPSFKIGKNNPMLEMCWCVWYLGKPQYTVYMPIAKGDPHGPEEER